MGPDGRPTDTRRYGCDVTLDTRSEELSPANEPLGPGADQRSFGNGMSVVALAGFASLSAGVVHAVAVGLHAGTRQLALVFVVTAVLQIGVGLWAIVRPNRTAACAVVAVNGAAVVGWLTTRLAGISWIDGLESRESPQFADTATALLGIVAVVAAYSGAILPVSGHRKRGFVVPTMLIGLLAVWTLTAAGTSTHSGGHDDTAVGGGHEVAKADATERAIAATEAHDDGHAPAADAATTVEPQPITGSVIEPPAAEAPAAEHGAGHETTAPQAALSWPRAWDPTQSIDVSGVEGVSVEQELRATKLIEDTLRELPRFADTADALAAGYVSIGDEGTGDEHFIKGDLIDDDTILDPTAPESLVYNVGANGERTLAGAMFIASPRPADDPTLTEWAGPLMTWHKHDNLCWSLDAAGNAQVVGLVDELGNCARGNRAGGESPMVHVWIQPHPCGVFAALEGVGAGTAAVPEDERVDMCNAPHDPGG